MRAGNYTDYAKGSWNRITKNGTKERNKKKQKGTEYNGWNRQELRE